MKLCSRIFNLMILPVRKAGRSPPSGLLLESPFQFSENLAQAAIDDTSTLQPSTGAGWRVDHLRQFADGVVNLFELPVLIHREGECLVRIVGRDGLLVCFWVSCRCDTFALAILPVLSR